MEIPSFITHYYLKERQPFLTLSELEGGQENLVFQNLITLHKNNPGYQMKIWKKISGHQAKY